MPKKPKNCRKRLIDLNNYNLSTDQVQEKPSLQIRSLLVRKAQAIQYLNGTTMPLQFRFREKEIEKIQSFLQACLKKQKKGYRFMMVTGSPGAGKTLSLNSVMSKMKCDVIRMNANLVKSVAEVQQLICLRLLGDTNTRTTSQILRQLQDAKYNKFCIVYIEEIEILFKTAPDIVSQDFLSLFLKKSVNLVLLGISNTIDTLQKYSGKYSFKVTEIQNVVFPPYRAEQIIAILSDKLKYIHQHFKITVDFPEKLLKFASQKLQTLKKGDFRICSQFLKQIVKRSFTAADNEENIYSITIVTINQIFNKMHISKNELMSTLPFNQKLILVGLHNIIKKTGGVYVNLNQLQPQLKWICNNLQVIHTGILMQDRLRQLQQYGMITVRRLKNFQIQILLKLGVEDIKTTFQQNEMLNKFLIG